MEFLYSRNRLNVATSRARCVAVVVREPGAAPRPRANAGADAPRERALPVRRAVSQPDASSQSTAADQQDAQISALV